MAPHLWLRAEVKPQEHRTALIPTACKQLLAEGGSQAPLAESTPIPLAARSESHPTPFPSQAPPHGPTHVRKFCVSTGYSHFHSLSKPATLQLPPSMPLGIHIHSAAAHWCTLLPVIPCPSRLTGFQISVESSTVAESQRCYSDAEYEA